MVLVGRRGIRGWGSNRLGVFFGLGREQHPSALGPRAASPEQLCLSENTRAHRVSYHNPGSG